MSCNLPPLNSWLRSGNFGDIHPAFHRQEEEEENISTSDGPVTIRATNMSDYSLNMLARRIDKENVDNCVNTLAKYGYVLGEFIGAGASASVFEGIHGPSGQRVSVRIDDPDTDPEKIRQTFLNLHLLHCMNKTIQCELKLVPITYDGAQTYIIVSKFVDGVSLFNALREMSKEDLDIVREKVINALKFAHSKGIVHNDLHEGNVLVAKDKTGRYRNPVIIDWEMSELLQDHNRERWRRHAKADLSDAKRLAR